MIKNIKTIGLMGLMTGMGLASSFAMHAAAAVPTWLTELKEENRNTQFQILKLIFNLQELPDVILQEKNAFKHARLLQIQEKNEAALEILLQKQEQILNNLAQQELLAQQEQEKELPENEEKFYTPREPQEYKKKRINISPLNLEKVEMLKSLEAQGKLTNAELALILDNKDESQKQADTPRGQALYQKTQVTEERTIIQDLMSELREITNELATLHMLLRETSQEGNGGIEKETLSAEIRVLTENEKALTAILLLVLPRNTIKH